MNKKIGLGIVAGIVTGVTAVKMVDKLKNKIVNNVMDDAIKILEMTQEINAMKENKEDNNEEIIEE